MPHSDLDESLKVANKVDTARTILGDVLRSITHLGQDFAAAEYKMSCFSEKIEVEAMREWLNWLSEINRQIADADEVLRE